MIRWLLMFTLFSISPAWADGPSGTWSKNCAKQPESATVKFEGQSVEVFGRRCLVPTWERGKVGWRAGMTCEGSREPKPIVFMPRGETMALVDYDGLNGLLAFCGGEKTDLLARLEGVWAKDREACRLYMSGELDNVDNSTVRRNIISSFESGKFRLRGAAVDCDLISLGDGRRLKITCQIKDYPVATSIGSVMFSGDDSINFNMNNVHYGDVDLIKCK